MLLDNPTAVTIHPAIMVRMPLVFPLASSDLKARPNSTAPIRINTPPRRVIQGRTKLMTASHLASAPLPPPAPPPVACAVMVIASKQAPYMQDRIIAFFAFTQVKSFFYLSYKGIA